MVLEGWAKAVARGERVGLDEIATGLELARSSYAADSGTLHAIQADAVGKLRPPAEGIRLPEAVEIVEGRGVRPRRGAAAPKLRLAHAAQPRRARLVAPINSLMRMTPSPFASAAEQLETRARSNATFTAEISSVTATRPSPLQSPAQATGSVGCPVGNTVGVPVAPSPAVAVGGGCTVALGIGSTVAVAPLVGVTLAVGVAAWLPVSVAV
jgi:hypothetical protein